MEFIWQQDDHSPKGFILRYKNNLPLIVKVTQGYCGIDDDDIYNYPQGEIYRLTIVKEQDRALFRDDQDQLYSIPVTYPIKFQIVKDGRKGPLKSLCELQKELRVGSVVMGEEDGMTSFNIHDETNREKRVQLDKLEFETLHTESYLVGNCIEDGLSTAEDWPTIVIPHYVDTRLTMACGVKGGTREDFDRVRAQVAQICAKYKHDTALGNQEIMLIDGDPDDPEDYENIKPKQYVRAEQVSRSEDYIVGKPNLALVKTQIADCLLQRKTPISTAQPVTQVKSTGPAASQSSSQRRPLPSLPIQTGGPRTRQNRTPPKPPPRRVYNNDNSDDTNWPPPPPPLTDEVDYEVPYTVGLHASKSIANKKSATSDAEYVNGKGIATAVCKPQVKGQKADDDDDYIQMGSLATSNKAQSMRKSCPSRASNVQVPQHLPRQDIDNKTPVTNEQQQNVTPYTSLNAVPKDLTALTVNEVAACLSLLKLDKYVPKFKEHDIDGSLLNSLDKEMLQTEFELTSFEVLKLYKFIHEGWRPT